MTEFCFVLFVFVCFTLRFGQPVLLLINEQIEVYHSSHALVEKQLSHLQT